MTAEQVLKKEDLPHLFDRFYRETVKNASGYGIGLSVQNDYSAAGAEQSVQKNHPQGRGRCLLFVSQSDKSL